MTDDDGVIDAEVVDDRKVQERLSVNVTRVEIYSAVIPTGGDGIPLEATIHALQRARDAGLPGDSIVTFKIDLDEFEVAVEVKRVTTAHPEHPGAFSLASPVSDPVPNTLRCEKCGTLFLIDLLGEGFTAEEVAVKRAAHDREFHS